MREASLPALQLSLSSTFTAGGPESFVTDIVWKFQLTLIIKSTWTLVSFVIVCYSLETAHLLGSAPYPGSPCIFLSTTISSLVHSFSPLLGECLFAANYQCSKILTRISPPSQKNACRPQLSLREVHVEWAMLNFEFRTFLLLRGSCLLSSLEHFSVFRPLVSHVFQGK